MIWLFIVVLFLWFVILSVRDGDIVFKADDLPPWPTSKRDDDASE